MAAKITYCFVSPFSTQETVSLIEKAIKQVGKVKKVDAARGYLRCKYSIDALSSLSIDFFVQRDPESCKVRAVINNEFLPTKAVFRNVDSYWDGFLRSLFRAKPGTPFGVSLASGAARIVGVLYLGDETQTVHRSRTTSGTSLLGFLAGGALLGPAGAVVGGMSGSQRTVGHSVEKFADKQLVRVIYNNGRLWEGSVSRDSEMYNEIMVNM